MSAELRVLLVRHAESTNNDLYRRTGSREGRDPDPRLSAHGEVQADLVAQAVAGERLGDVPVWSSPTARAVRTAGAIVRAGTGSAIDLVPDLVEGGGIYARAGDVRRPAPGRPLDELAAIAGVRTRWGAAAFADWGGGFEEHGDIPARGERLVAAVRAAAHPTLVLVAHEWFAQHVIRAALGLNLGNDACLRGWFRVPNASITELHLHDDGSADLVRLGVDAHLASAPDRAPARVV